MKKISYLTVLIALLLLASCRPKSGGGGIKVENFSTGKAGEMILAIDTNYWSTAAKKAIYDVLQQPQPAINQNEPMFDVIECSNAGYKASFMRHRNIVQFDYNPDYSGNTFEIARNPVTNPQVHVRIRGNSQDSCLALFLSHQDEIVKVMYENDIARLQNAHRRLNNAVIEKKIKEKFGLVMTIPEGYFVGREEEDFLWLLFRTPKNDRFVMIYKSPRYVLSPENVVAERDRITKAYIQGAVVGAYPKVAELEGLPLAQNLQIRYLYQNQ